MKCRKYRVRVVEADGSEVERFELITVNASMARLCVRMDYPRTWGKRLITSVVRESLVTADALGGR